MTAGSAPIDVSDMYPVHNVFRDTLHAAPDLVGSVDADDQERLELVVSYYTNILDFLEAHHAGEEELVFPLLKERLPDQAGLVDTIADQHHDVLGLVGESTQLLGRWSAGDAGAQGACADTLAALGRGMSEHLSDEEQRLLPLCAGTLSAEEWGQLPAHGMQAFGGDKIWLILGLIRERMNDNQRDEMLAHMPPPAVDMWTAMGEAAFGEFTSRLGPVPVTTTT